MDETSTVSIYSCGPTLNDYIHIGAYRNFVLADILKKHFGVKGYYCKHGMNIMDARKHFAFNVIFYCNQFKTEYELMNLELPNIITFTTQNTTEILSIVDDLLNRKVAYTTTEGTFVDISKIDGYGELTGISAKGNFCFNDTSLNKRNTSDFAIWKFDKDDSRGYPGWDIQCAANCIIHLNNSLDYIIVGFNELVHTENINTLINLYPRKVTNTKWIRIHYVDFQDDVPLFYLKDFIDKGFSRQLIKYMLYITNYNSEIKLSSKYINDCKKNYEKINQFYKKLCDLDMVERNSKDEKIIIDYEKIDRQFCELKTANIMSDLFSIIKKHNKIQSGTSRNNIETLKKYVEYLNERLDFIER